MLKQERLQKIVEIIDENKFISVSSLAKMLKVTEMTIRRDLSELENDKIIKKVHGGAKSYNEFFDRKDAYLENINNNEELKRQISKLAARSIKNKDVVFIGAGTTTFYMTDFIEATNIIIVTNSQPIMEKLSDRKDITLICTGGTYRKETRSYIGPIAERVVSDMRFNKTFLGVNGIDKTDIYTSYYEAVLLYKKVLNNSINKYIITDNTKFNRVDFISFYKTKDINLFITDDNISDINLKKYSKQISILTPSIYNKSNEDTI